MGSALRFESIRGGTDGGAPPSYTGTKHPISALSPSRYRGVASNLCQIMLTRAMLMTRRIFLRYDLEFESDDLEEEIMVAKLCDAAISGDVGLCRKLLRRGVSAVAGDVDGRTPLHLAAAAGKTEVLRLFVDEEKVNVNVADNWGNTCIRDAVRFQKHATIQWLIDHGAELNETNTDSGTFLRAANDGDVQTILSMVLAGVDVNCTDYDGRSALHLAAAEGKPEVVRALLARGASAEVQDRWGGTALDDALRYRRNAVAAMLTACVCSSSSVDEGATDSSATNPAAVGGSGREEMAPSQTTTSTTELLAAARLGDLSEIKRLKKKRVDMLGVDYDGRSGLHVAAAAGHLHVVVYLANQTHANINVQDNFNHTPLADAVRSSHFEVVQWLKQKGAVVIDNTIGSQLCQAAFEGDVAHLKQARRAGVDYNTADYDGRTGMHLAAAEGRVDVLQLLWDCGAGCNIKDRWGGTPMEDAIKAKKQEAVNRLLELIEAEAREGATAEGVAGSRRTTVASSSGGGGGGTGSALRRRNLKGGGTGSNIAVYTNSVMSDERELLIQVDNVDGAVNVPI